jgi:hypothetical protein
VERDQRFVAGQCRELVRRGAERQPGDRRNVAGAAFGILGMRVEPRADRGTAERQLLRLSIFKIFTVCGTSGTQTL